MTVSKEVRNADIDKYNDLKGLIYGQTTSAPVRQVDLPMFPLLHGKVFVRIMDIDGKYKVDEAMREANRDSGDSWRIFHPKVVLEAVMASACDADGDLIFTELDRPFLSSPKPDGSPRMDRRFMEAVWRAAFDLNDMFARAASATAKNSEETGSSLESSDSAVSGTVESEPASTDLGTISEFPEETEPTGCWNRHEPEPIEAIPVAEEKPMKPHKRITNP